MVFNQILRSCKQKHQKNRNLIKNWQKKVTLKKAIFSLIYLVMKMKHHTVLIVTKKPMFIYYQILKIPIKF